MKYLVMFCALSILIACGEEEEKKKPVAEPAKKEVLTETKNGTFTQYYPGKKKVKFQGPQDAEGRRHGIWYFYDERGTQISMTDYKHGVNYRRCTLKSLLQKRLQECIVQLTLR